MKRRFVDEINFGFGVLRLSKTRKGERYEKSLCLLFPVLFIFGIIVVPVMAVLPETELYAVEKNTVSTREDISCAEVKNFLEEILPTQNNIEQNIEIVLNGKVLVENTDYTIWYYNNYFPGTAKMLIVGCGEYEGYIEKQYKILEEFQIDFGENIVLRPSDGVKIRDTSGYGYSNCDSISLSLNGKYLGDLRIDAVAKEAICYSDLGQYILVYAGSRYESGWRWDSDRKCMVQYTEKYSDSYTTKITTVNDEVTKVEVAEIVENGREQYLIHAVVAPLTAADQTLVWSSSNPEIATIDNWGVVTVHKPGEALIYATASNGVHLSVELDIKPMQLSKINAVVDIVCDYNAVYKVGIADRFGPLREDIDYTVNMEEQDNSTVVTVTGKGLYSGVLKRIIDHETGKCWNIGDINGDNIIDIADSLALFRHSMLPVLYPVSYVGRMDFSKDEVLDVTDALVLFRHSMLPDLYPLEN